MVLGRRGFGTLFLTVAGILFCLLVLSTTSSGAQERTEAQDGGAAPTAGDDECIEFQDDTGTGTGEDTGTDTGGNTTTDTGGNTTDTGGDTANRQIQQNENTGDRQAQRNGNTGDRQAQQNGNTGSQQAQQNGNASDPQAQQNGNTGDQQAQQNENGGNGGDPQASQDGQDDTTSPGTEGTGAEECIIEDTFPDKSLPPTGAPVKPQADAAAEKEQKRSDRSGEPETRNDEQKNSDRGGKPESRSEEQKKPGRGEKLESRGEEQQKPAQDKKPENSGENQKKSGQGRKQENSGEEQRKPDRGVEKLEIKDRVNKVGIEDRSGKKPRQERLGTRSKAASTRDPAPKLAAGWPRPTRTEVASASRPRHFAPSPGSEMTLSARALGIYNAPIKSSGRPEDLDNGLVRVPETSLPWDKGAQKNVYVAGHYLGNSGSASRLVFYNLHRLKKNDEIVLRDDRGQPYKYRVSETFAAGPEDSWAMGQVRNRDMLTLQTCIPPDFGKRLIVRADRVR